METLPRRPDKLSYPPALSERSESNGFASTRRRFEVGARLGSAVPKEGARFARPVGQPLGAP